jgi:hypothetical protein
MKRSQVVFERDDRATEAPLEAPDLHGARQDPLVRSPYLTTPEAAAYVRAPTVAAFHKWRVKYGVPSYGTRTRQLFLKRDLEDGLKPVAQRGQRRYFHAYRGGRS